MTMETRLEACGFVEAQTVTTKKVVATVDGMFPNGADVSVMPNGRIGVELVIGATYQSKKSCYFSKKNLIALANTLLAIADTLED
jgi:hypothetical protein